MPAPTRDQAWPEPTIKAPTGNAGLPVPAPESGRIAVFPRRELAGESAPTAEKRRRSPFRLLSFVAVVAVPAILAGVYYFLIAADQYVAEFRFALRTIEPVRIDPGSILGADRKSVV